MIAQIGKNHLQLHDAEGIIIQIIHRSVRGTADAVVAQAGRSIRNRSQIAIGTGRNRSSHEAPALPFIQAQLDLYIAYAR